MFGSGTVTGTVSLSLLTAAPLPPGPAHFFDSPAEWQNNNLSGREIIAYIIHNFCQIHFILIWFHVFFALIFPPSLFLHPPHPPLLSIHLQSRIWLCLQSPAPLQMCADLINLNAVLYKLLINRWLLSANTFCTEGLLMKGKPVLPRREGRRRRESAGEGWDDTLIRNARLQQHYSISYLWQGHWFRVSCWFSSIILLH